MKPYPSFFHAYTSQVRPVIGFFDPANLDKVSNRIRPTSQWSRCRPVAGHGTATACGRRRYDGCASKKVCPCADRGCGISELVFLPLDCWRLFPDILGWIYLWATLSTPKAMRHEHPSMTRKGDDTVGNPHRAQNYQFKLFELKFISISSFSSLSSCWNWTNSPLSSNSRQQYALSSSALNLCTSERWKNGHPKRARRTEEAPAAAEEDPESGRHGDEEPC